MLDAMQRDEGLTIEADIRNAVVAGNYLQGSLVSIDFSTLKSNPIEFVSVAI